MFRHTSVSPLSQDVEIQGKFTRYNSKVRLYLPHDFDENRRYPMLVDVYAGPNSQQVNFKICEHHSLV